MTSRRALARAMFIILASCPAACRDALPAAPAARQAVRLAVSALTPGSGAVRPFPVEALEKALPDIDVLIEERFAAVPAVEALQNGSADITFSFADVAYLAYAGHLEPPSAPFDRLRGMAMLHVSALHLIVRGDSSITDVAGLRGARVSIGPAQSATALTARTVLRSFGVEQAIMIVPVENLGEAATRLASGAIDAMFVNVNFPPVGLATRVMAQGARLLTIDGPPVVRLRREYPFLRSALLPPRTYPNQPGPIHTVGVHGVFICRADLDEALVYRLTKALLDGLPSLAVGLTPLQSVDLDEAPATPIPLHPGAARYYRERELAR